VTEDVRFLPSVPEIQELRYLAKWKMDAVQEVKRMEIAVVARKPVMHLRTHLEDALRTLEGVLDENLKEMIVGHVGLGKAITFRHWLLLAAGKILHEKRHREDSKVDSSVLDKTHPSQYPLALPRSEAVLLHRPNLARAASHCCRDQSGLVSTTSTKTTADTLFVDVAADGRNIIISLYEQSSKM
jgi:hypothetical protein